MCVLSAVCGDLGLGFVSGHLVQDLGRNPGFFCGKAVLGVSVSLLWGVLMFGLVSCHVLNPLYHGLRMQWLHLGLWNSFLELCVSTWWQSVV